MRFVSNEAQQRLIAANADCRDLFEDKIFEVNPSKTGHELLDQSNIVVVELEADKKVIQ